MAAAGAKTFMWTNAAETALCYLDKQPTPGCSEVLRLSMDPAGVNLLVLRMLEHVDPKKFVVTFDIDATVLKEDARAKSGVQRNHPIGQIYDVCTRRGIGVYFITARPRVPGNEKATREQLAALGYTKFEEPLYMRPNSLDTWLKIAQFKFKCRREILEKTGKDIFINVGDSLTDVVDVKSKDELDALTANVSPHAYCLFKPREARVLFAYKLPLPKEKKSK